MLRRRCFVVPEIQTEYKHDNIMMMRFRLLWVSVVLGVVGSFQQAPSFSSFVPRWRHASCGASSSDDETVLPWLQPCDWPLRERCATKQLVGRGGEFPVVALARMEGGRPQFLGRSAETKELRSEAVKNLLGQRRPHWLPAVGDGSDLDQFIVVAVGDFSSEHILDETFLQEAQTLVSSTSGLLLAIPRRTVLLACSNDADRAIKEVFYFLAEEYYRQTKEQKLTRLLFLCDNDGSLAACLPPPPRVLNDAYLKVDDDKETTTKNAKKEDEGTK